MAANTDVLMADARCIQQCIPGSDYKLAVLIKLFATLAGVPTDTASLLAGTECIFQCIPGPDMKLAVLISLLDQIAGGGSVGGGITCGTGAPTSVPASGCAIYIQTDSQPLPGQYWSYFGGAWHGQ